MCIFHGNGIYWSFIIVFHLNRSNLKQLLRNLNSQKNVIKKHGICVDGKKYTIIFTGVIQRNINIFT